MNSHAIFWESMIFLRRFISCCIYSFLALQGSIDTVTVHIRYSITQKVLVCHLYWLEFGRLELTAIFLSAVFSVEKDGCYLRMV